MSGEAATDVKLDIVPAPAEDTKQAVPPCVIYRTTPGALPFHVDDFGSWMYQEFGVFACGHWASQTEPRDVLIPYERIDFIEFDFAAEPPA